MLLIPIIRQTLVSIPRRYGAKDAGIREEQVEHQLRVESPVSRVVEDKYCVDSET